MKKLIEMYCFCCFKIMLFVDLFFNEDCKLGCLSQWNFVKLCLQTNAIPSSLTLCVDGMGTECFSCPGTMPRSAHGLLGKMFS